MPPDRLGDLRVHIQFRTHPVKQIRAIERSDQHRRVREPELLDDVAAHALGRGRGVGVNARARKTRLQLREPAIFGPEIMSPLADAVRLVDREAGNLQARRELEKSRRQQPLRRDEYKMMPAAGELALDVTNFHLIHAAMNRRRRIAGQPQRIDLVLHQRDKRRDHDVGAPSDRRRHLVAERLAAPGRHHDQRVAAVESRLNRLELQRPQALESPKPPQDRKHFVRRTPARLDRNAIFSDRIIERLHRSPATISSRPPHH